jgi:adenine-specific DNA-methyltransferase
VINKTRMSQDMKNRTRSLRRKATEPEQLLWSHLRNRRLANVKFRRQHPIAGFVLDFYCAEARLGIELDGSGHRGVRSSRDDLHRTKVLAEQHGIQVLRFWNHDVTSRCEQVLGVLRDAVQERLERAGSFESGA